MKHLPLFQHDPVAGSLPNRHFPLVLADPAWRYRDKLRMGVRASGRPDRGHRGAESHYKRTMALVDIMNMPVPHLALKDAHLYLWVTNAFMREGHMVAEAWDFRVQTIITWVKVSKKGTPKLGMGNHFRNTTEHMLFCVRGSLPPLRRNLPTHFLAQVPRQHSRKPEESYALIEKMSPGPRLELFARRRREGWTGYGDQLPREPKLFPKE